MKPVRLLCLVCLLMLGKLVFGQVGKTDLPKLLAAKKFVFQATTAIPFADAGLSETLRAMGNPGGGTVQLNSSVYNLAINPDSIVAFLPYYGRSYSANLNPGDSGIKFTSKKFAYDITQKKKGGWIIRIRPQDVKSGQRFTLTVSESGYATLNAYHDQRQTIFFDGYISKPENIRE
ncbi:MAG: DUF4251 domain-containing protein [Sphingobacteriaceae bacterium]